MTPISTALPSPLVSVEDDHVFPVQDIAAVPGTASVFQLNLKIRNETSPVEQAAALYGGIGGAGSTFEVQANSGGAPGNVFCTRVISTASVGGGGFIPALFRPSWGPASAWTPGAVTAPGNVVGAYSVMWALTDPVDNFPDDSTGFCFIPTGGIPVPSNFADSLRIGSTPLNGFGIFFNSDGAGAAVVEYVAWSGAGTLERIRVAASVVPDLTDWNSTRFAIVSAASGREATLTVNVNGVDILVAREFGSVELDRPDGVDADALQYAFGVSTRSGGGEGYYYQNWGYNGRFTPDGTEMQTFGA